MSLGARALDGGTDELSGRVLGDRYRLSGLIARGGMGAVYRAEHLGLGLVCAVKVITEREVGADEHSYLERFGREAMTTARLRHPNVVQVFDYGRTPDGVHYLAMELLEGVTLGQALKTSGPLDAARFFRTARELVAGVKAAHDLGIVHRDLKPGNIFLLRTPEGTEMTKVLDFGVAKPIRGELPALTRPGTVLGTPKYMAPEQIMGAAVDARADVYALGVILFEMLVGRVPFTGPSDVDVMAAHVRAPVPSMESVRPGAMIPEVLEDLVRGMLAKEASQRTSSLADVLDALRRLELSYALPHGVAPHGTPHSAGPHALPDDTVITPYTGPTFGVGSVLDERYSIDARIADGSSSTVYAATAVKSGKRVAVKVMDVAGDDPRAVVRCMREARSASRVSHPNIVEVYDVGMVDGRPYVVMERLAGAALSKALESSAIRRAELLSALVPAMRGLAAAHAAGISHADLKPSDLIVCPLAGGAMRVAVIDFGVARLIDEPHLRMTRAGDKTVPPHYAAPEQLRRQPHDHRVDIYAMGVIAYEVVTGVRAFEGRNFGAVSIDVASKVVPPAATVAPSVPVPLSNAIAKAMARDPKDRFDSMQAFVDALLPYTLDVDREASMVDTVRMPVRKPAAPWAVIAALLVALALLGSTITWLALR